MFNLLFSQKASVWKKMKIHGEAKMKKKKSPRVH